MWALGRPSAPAPKASAKHRTEELLTLSPDLIIRILTFLPVPELSKVARLSRRLKVLCYNDQVYEPKLRILGVPLPPGSASNTPPATRKTPGNSKAPHSPTISNDAVGKKLKNMKGGNKLPSARAYLNAGTIWGPKMRDAMTMVTGLVVPYATPNVPPRGDAASSLPPQDLTPPDSPSVSPKKKAISPTGSSALLNIRMPSRDLFRMIFEELKPYYIDFREKADSDTSIIFREFTRTEDIALTLHKMSLFCGGRFIEDAKAVGYAVAATLEYFESSLLAQFEASYNRKDYAKMKDVAHAAYRLNGGASVVQLFISKNPIFFDEQSNPTLFSKGTSTEGSSPRTVTHALAEQFGSFMQHTLQNVREQAEVIRVVFPIEMEAMASFMSAVFEQSISEFLSTVLSEARAASTGQASGYLHTLATTVQHTGMFLEFISGLDEFAGEDGAEKIRKTVWATYKPYYAAYLEEEIAALNAAYGKTIDSWNTQKTRSRAASSSADAILDGNSEAYKKNVMAAVKTVLLAPSYLTKSLLGPILRLGTQPMPQDTLEQPQASGGTSRPVTPDPSPTRSEEQEAEKISKLRLDDGHMTMLLSLEMSLSMIHSNREALKRCVLITQTLKEVDTRPSVESIFCVLMRNLGDKHIGPGFRDAIYRLGRSSSNEDRDKSVAHSLSQFFELVHVADLIQQMVHVYFADDVVPYIDPNDFLSKISTEKKAFERSLDDNVALGMDRAIQVLVEHVEYILETEQGIADFNPPPGKLADMKPSKTCRKVIDLLNKNGSMLRGVADKSMIEVFLQEIGIRAFTALIKHIKSRQISQEGAMQLIADINAYYDWAISLRNSDTTRLFSVLKEIGNLYIVDRGVDLKELVHDHERYQGRLRPEEILELLQSRTDYKKIQHEVESADCVVM